MRQVRFLKHFGSWNDQEVAGFNDDYAAVLIKTGVAEAVVVAIPSAEVAAPEPVEKSQDIASDAEVTSTSRRRPPIAKY